MERKDVLVVYSTVHGQAETIARRIADAASTWGATAVVQDVKNTMAVDLVEPRSIIIVASVHFGRHSRAITRFVRENRARLGEKHTAFLSVSGDAVDAATRPRAERYVREFIHTTNWAPTASLLVGGAVLFTKYGWFMRYVTRRSFAKKGVELDPRRDYDYTDWDTVLRFAKMFVTSETAQVA